jgi:hypothetical protein
VFTFHTALLGVVGAAGSLVLVYVIPIGIGLYHGTIHPEISLWRVIGGILILAGTLFIGALAAVLVGGSDDKTALAAGLAYQSTIAGIVKKTG